MLVLNDKKICEYEMNFCEFSLDKAIGGNGPI